MCKRVRTRTFVMNSRLLLGAIFLVSATVLTGGRLVSQGQAATDAPEAGQPDTESMVEKMVQYAMPGERHKLLDRMAGRWKIKVEYRMSADAPVVESEGTCERKWILDGRFLLEEFDGGDLALPFKGMAIYGYDAYEQKYTSVWVDSLNTSITTNMGVCKDSCDVIEFVGTHGDAWSGTKKKTRGVTRFVSEKEHLLELHEPGADGQEYLVLKIVYSRA
jgi:hypothetical protein